MKKCAEYNGETLPPLDHLLSKDAKIEGYVDQPEQLRMYLSEKGKWHVRYRHYDSEKTLKSIFNNKSLILSDGSGWNDLKDRNRFNNYDSDCDHVNFGMCFSFLQVENVAMWYMYAGKATLGGCLRLSRYDLHKICNQSVPRLVSKKDKAKVIKVLSKGEFSIRITDVAYQGKKGADNRIALSHLGDSRVVVDSSVLNGLEEIIKNEPWSYENECRLIVAVRKEAIPTELLGNCSIMLPLPSDTIKKLDQKMVKAPNYCSDGFLKDKMESDLTDEIDLNWLNQ